MATYRLVRKLAAGGMAEVFLAKVVGAEGFEKPVAVKRILPSLAQDQEFVELFLREAKLTVSLQHANVVQVFDLGAVRGQYYMVMEFVDGENLRGLQRAATAQQVPLGLREVCFIVQQVAEGLAYAHEKLDASGRPLNLIHRDINPSNVMISTAGEVKLADFGIAKVANAQSGTEVGVVKGKVGYLAPEQVRGAAVDQRADLFLLGLLLYELLSGQQLFSGPDYFQILRSISSFDVKTTAQSRELTRKLFHKPPVAAMLFAGALRSLYDTSTVRALAAEARASRAYLTPEVLGALEVPVLLLWGESDRLLPSESLDYFRAHLPPHSEIHLVKGFGHVPQMERPGELVSHLVRFADARGL